MAIRNYLSDEFNLGTFAEASSEVCTHVSFVSRFWPPF
jgi:hypothetical protein